MKLLILISIIFYSVNSNSQISGQLFCEIDFPINSGLNVELIDNSKSFALIKSDEQGKFKFTVNKNHKIVDLRITNWQLIYILKNIDLTDSNIDLGQVFLPLLSDISVEKYQSLQPELKSKYKFSADYTGAHYYSDELLDESFLKFTCHKKQNFIYDFNYLTNTVIIEWSELKCK